MALLEVQAKHCWPSGPTVEVDFAVYAGVVSLFGPSGAGKSTLLSIIAGFLRPQTGRVILDGKTLFDSTRRVHLPPERRGVGFVFQDLLLFPHMTVQENLRYGQPRRGMHRDDFARVVEVLELSPLLDRRPDRLSGGERQRVALGRALLRQPSLLMLDEPLTALDQELHARILTYLERVLSEWKIPTLYVSHNQVEVRRLASHVLALRDGTIIDQGPTSEVLGHRTMLEMSGSLGPVNLVRVSQVHEDSSGMFQGRLGRETLLLPNVTRTTSEVLVAFPPSSVALARETPSQSSVRNKLRGVIRSQLSLGERVFVELDVGERIWAEITPQAWRELGLQVGSEVVCTVKTRSLQIVE